MPAPALLDATPLAGAHAARGIGAAVRGPDRRSRRPCPPSDRPVLLVRAGQDAAGRASRRARSAGRAWPLHRLPDPWPWPSGSARRGGGPAGGAVPRRAARAGAAGPDRGDLPRPDPRVLSRSTSPGRGGRARPSPTGTSCAAWREARLVLTPSHETAADVGGLARASTRRGCASCPWRRPMPAAPGGGRRRRARTSSTPARSSPTRTPRSPWRRSRGPTRASGW